MIIMEGRNRFKGLDLIDRVPDELWNEIRDIESLSYLKNMMQDFKATLKKNSKNTVIHSK